MVASVERTQSSSRSMDIDSTLVQVRVMHETLLRFPRETPSPALEEKMMNGLAAIYGTLNIVAERRR